MAYLRFLKKKAFFLFVLVPLLSVCSKTVLSQSAKETPTPEATSPFTNAPKLPPDSLIVNVNLDAVTILVTARNHKGNYIPSLKKNDFLILEDGDEQPIISFKQDTVPVNVVFLIDASHSVESVLPNLVHAAVTFASQLRPGDKYAAVIFAHKPIKILDWGDNLQSFQNVIRKVKTFGKTALYDCMQYVIENMFEGVEGKRIMIILSDGVDNSSTKSLVSVMRLASEKEVTVYPIIDSFRQSQHYRDLAKNDRDKLRNVSKYFVSYLDVQNEFIELEAKNGGRIIWSDGYTDLKSIYDVLVEELKHQYALSYVPQPQKQTDKDFKEVTVKLRRVPGDVFVRLGFFQEQ